ncbi:MAG: hypothetical protein CO042_04925 [Parcubacteria group bacterium CG_4_9_14_0_2_um_filter_41_8]|nr:MAG: hypothetical protein AUJ34_00610 [Parcubacteria group bacterium CG1_02_41_12]PIQ79779.1 MAG: hypothetical protein COV79_03135 [Parcubacteria group bacterium CG11_big_fil_rev_8_21_14_0_20_41_14]PIR56730.1 MAG: hypothetical protein COU72_04715 [Parcubacteria group bacterium CG10_big_fil_rev_8_21_14_0_10_41_35]PIZ82366.1 MAG: hypothetical protein COY02_00360 [Parcubacteria group bacterium CG_4_10_14_0_2_um_filter_41_6]PJC40228.1 MAG: hypothetical protein CO042_04925 [Parcubacteria group ba
MYYATRKGYINIILIILALIALLALVGWLGYNIGRNIGASNDPSSIVKIITDPTEVALIPISLAQNANLHRSTGLAKVGIAEGKVEIDVLLEEGVSLPQGAAMSAWLVDAGNLGGLGEKSVSELDQQYGTPFANVDFSQKVDDAPFALYLGRLTWDSALESMHLFYEVNDLITPYDAIMITLESDGNNANYDPRPGTPIMIGEIQ